MAARQRPSWTIVRDRGNIGASITSISWHVVPCCASVSRLAIAIYSNNNGYNRGGCRRGGALSISTLVALG